ncbi:MAG: molybdate ABC transporter substrate-binding protein [Cyclobacteriaceae bacterium]
MNNNIKPMLIINMGFSFIIAAMHKLSFVVICALVIGCNQSSNNAIRLAVAANAYLAIDSLVSTYDGQLPIEITISSSGKLTTQIIQGAPFDLLISADELYPQAIVDAGLSYSPPSVFAEGFIILMGANRNDISIDNIAQLKRIAIANPRLAPYGKASLQFLKNAQINGPEYVFGESINQVNQYIISGNVPLGITAKSTIRIPEADGLSWVEVDKNLYDPIKQSCVIIDREQPYMQEIVEFYQFLQSKQAQEVLNYYGYKTPQ